MRDRASKRKPDSVCAERRYQSALPLHGMHCRDDTINKLENDHHCTKQVNTECEM